MESKVSFPLIKSKLFNFLADQSLQTVQKYWKITIIGFKNSSNIDPIFNKQKPLLSKFYEMLQFYQNPVFETWASRSISLLRTST